ncbi:MAG: VWA domain-containing protein, partial [Acidimicrobiia bacterium]|nr:VWA domain-containing protein [Acidimicrobiia bacterium]
TTNHPEVAVTVSVENQLLGDQAPVFKIIEDGRVRRVTVAATASSDLKVVLLLDVSGSMRGAPLEAAKAAAARFVSEMPAGVQIGIISFGNSPALAAEFTDDRQTLLSAIDLLTARGETALYDGLVAAGALFSNESSEGRAVVLLSDGGDTVSSSSLEDAVLTVGELQAKLFAVELQSPENDSDALLALADAGGGTVTSADDPAAIEALFGEIASELLSSYRLVYTSEAFELASLRVDVIAEGSVVAGATRWIELPADASIVDGDPVDTEPGPVDPAPVVVPPPRRGTTVELTWLESAAASWLGAGAVFVAFAIIFVTIALRPRVPRGARGSSTLTSSSQVRAREKKTALSTIADSATAFAEQTLNRGDRFKTLNAALERAGVVLRPGELIVLTGSGALAAAAIGFLLLNEAFGLLFGAIVIGAVPLWLESKKDKRSALFGEQLGDTLQLMATSMRAGYGLLQAIDAVAEEALSPTAEEFQRIKIETHLGRDLDDSLKAAAGRVDSEDFRWVAEAIEIHRQIGGDLAEILDAVNETIRDRNRIRRRIKSLSAEGRISGIILSLIPIVLVFVILIINPGYIGELTSSGLGQGLIVGGIVAWLIAVAWMRKIIRLQF